MKSPELISVAKSVHEICKKGKNKEDLVCILEGVSEDERRAVLSSSIPDDESDQVCPPLVIAALKGNLAIVETLLHNFRSDLDLEIPGKVKLGDYTIDDASALWCAAGSGHLKIVKVLVMSGADVNSKTKSKSTPLRAACFDGRQDIVEFLLKHGADVNAANEFNNTSLMIASHKGHRAVARVLIERGADVNLRACCGATSLHFAAESGNVDIVEELVDYGNADIDIANDTGLTPLLLSAERCQESVFDFLLSKTTCLAKRIDALELLGASLANDKENYDLDKCYIHLVEAMKLRMDHSEFREKELLDPIDAYNFHRECRTLHELESIRGHPNDLHMEGLSIRERILGRKNQELPHPIIYRGAVFADQGNFSRCVRLWLHALKLKLATKLSVAKDLLRFAQVFCQMIQVGLEVTFIDLSKILSCTAEEIINCQTRIRHPAPRDDPESHQDDLESNMLTLLYLTNILSRSVKSISDSELVEVMRSLHKVVSTADPRTRDGRSLLHLAVDAETYVDGFHVNAVVKFPCAGTTKLFVDAGADPGALDKLRDTPLHVIVRYKEAVEDFMTLHSIITDLVNARGHVDVVNDLGKTPMEAAVTSIASTILKSQISLSLKCLSAQTVMKHRIPFRGQVPSALEYFIELHGRKI